MTSQYMLIDKNTVIPVIQRYFRNELVADDEWQFPYIDNNKLCVFDPEKTIGTKNKLVSLPNPKSINELKMNDPIIANFMAKYQVGARAYYYKKSVICMTFYVLSKIIHEDTKQSLLSLSQVHYDDWPLNTQSTPVEQLIRTIAKLIAYEKSDGLLLAVLKNSGVMRNDAVVKLIARIQTNPSYLADMPIVDFFTFENETSIYRNLEMLPEDALGHVYTFVREQLGEQGNANASNPGDKIKFITDKLRLLDTAACIHIHDDDDAMGKPFKEYTMKELSAFINVNNGYCFAYSYLGTNIIGSRGNINLRAIGSIPSAEIPVVSRGLAAYYAKNEPLVNQQTDLFDMLVAYRGQERKVVVRFFEANGMKESFGVFDDAERGFKLAQPLTRAQLAQFFTFILKDFNEALVQKNIEVILRLSCGTIFDAIGFLGWICYSDDVDVFDNSSGKYFQISNYCLGLFPSLCENLKTIPTPDGTSNLFDAIKDFKFGKSSLATLLEGVESTCIHGVGASFLRYYINAYVQCQRVVAAMNAEDAQEILCCPKEYFNDTFKLAPFLISNKYVKTQAQAPPIPYFTALRFDQIKGMNPLNSAYLLLAFDNEGNSTHIGHYIPKHPIDNLIEPTDYIKNMGNYTITARPGKECLATVEWFADMRGKGPKVLRDMINTAERMQKHRKVLFKIVCDYTVHVCKTMTQPTDAYKRIFHAGLAPRFDPISMEDVAPIPKFLSVIDLSNNQTLLNVARGNAGANKNANVTKRFNVSGLPDTPVPTGKQLEVDQRKYYVDTLANVAALPYSKDDKGQACVVEPFKGIDITRAAQYAQLLSKLLSPTDYTVTGYGTPTLPDRKIQLFAHFEEYYLKLKGQASTLRNSLFHDLSLYLSKPDGDVATYDKTRMPQYKTDVAANKDLENDVKETLLQFADIVTTIHCANASVKLQDLCALSVPTSARAVWRALIRDIVVRMTYLILTFRMYFYYIKNNIDQNGALMMIAPKTIQPNVGVANILFIAKGCLDQAPKPKALCASYDTVLYNELIYKWLFPEVTSPDLLPYHFRELSRELYLLQDMRKRMFKPETDKNTNVDMIMRKQKVSETQRAFELSLDVVNESFPWFREDDDNKLKLRDYQESIRLRLEYMIKTSLIGIHETRMIDYEQVEITLNNIITSMPYNTSAVYFSEDSLQKEFAVYNQSLRIEWTDGLQLVEKLMNMFSLDGMHDKNVQGVVWCVVMQAYMNTH
jgi:hypothetical protein